MNKNLKLLLIWLPVLVWLVAISCFSTESFNAKHTGQALQQASTISGQSWLSGLHHYIRKTAHLTEYAILGVLLTIALVNSWPRFYRQRGAVVLTALCSTYALFDEIHQAFVPSRTPSAVDVTIDMFGAAMAIYLLFRFRHLRKAIKWADKQETKPLTAI